MRRLSNGKKTIVLLKPIIIPKGNTFKMRGPEALISLEELSIPRMTCNRLEDDMD